MTPPTRDELEAKMRRWDPTEPWTKHPAWESFVNHFIEECMHYGPQELHTAWYFYSCGWEASS